MDQTLFLRKIRSLPSLRWATLDRDRGFTRTRGRLIVGRPTGQQDGGSNVSLLMSTPKVTVIYHTHLNSDPQPPRRETRGERPLWSGIRAAAIGAAPKGNSSKVLDQAQMGVQTNPCPPVE